MYELYCAGLAVIVVVLAYYCGRSAGMRLVLLECEAAGLEPRIAAGIRAKYNLI